ncbi:hypothetical protein SCUP515_04331 [Seiridium cupressi]
MRRFENIWHKRQLVPNWILQCIAAGIFMIAAGLLIAAAAYVKNNESDLELSDYEYYGYSVDDLVKFSAITGGVIFAFAILTIIFDIVECVLYARRVLNPVTLLVLAVLKTLAWGIYFIMAIVSAVRGSVGWLDILLSAVLVSTSLSQLIMGARYTHRMRKGTLDNRGAYKPTVAGQPGAGAMPGFYAGPQPQYQQPHENPFNDTAYRSPSPQPPAYGQPPHDANLHGYAHHDVEMQPQKPMH